MTTELIPLNEEQEPMRYTTPASVLLAKTEIEAQIAAAHQYRRSVTRFRQEALSMATLSQEIAESCIYTVPRDGKNIAGPSVRLAEICSSAYGNLHVGARVVDVTDTEIVAQGVAHDMEKNLRATIEVRRRITKKNGQRFNEDMITVAGNAACSIALRNAIFRVVPRAYVDDLYQRVREVAVGNASTLADRRAKILERLGKLGADQARVIAALGVNGIEDIGLEQMEILIGHGTAIKDGSKAVDEVFPAPLKELPGAHEEGKRMSLSKAKAEPKKMTIIIEGGPAPHDQTTGEVIEEPGAEG